MKITGFGILKVCCFAASGLIFGSAVSAAELDKLAAGQAAFNAGNYTLSFSLWSTRATQGDAAAQVFVGLSYDNGWGTDKNAQLARVWYLKAARKNNSSGQYLLGLNFIQGSKTDRAKGLMWLQRAADNGDSAAQQFLHKGKQRGWFKDIRPLTPPEKPAPQTVALAG